MPRPTRQSRRRRKCRCCRKWFVPHRYDQVYCAGSCTRPVTCPDCGKSRRVRPVTFRKIARGVQSARCPHCSRCETGRARSELYAHCIEQHWPSGLYIVNGIEITFDGTIWLRDCDRDEQGKQQSRRKRELAEPAPLIRCPSCGNQRRSTLSSYEQIRDGRCTGKCRSCSVVKARPSADAVLETGATILWSTHSFNSSTVAIRCSCGTERPVQIHCLSAPAFTGLCGHCCKLGSYAPNWKGGRSLGSNGYPHLKISILDPALREIAEKLVRKSGYVSESRLLRSLEDGQALDKTQHCHHRDLSRDANVPSNLEATTGVDHPTEHVRIVRRVIAWAAELAKAGLSVPDEILQHLPVPVQMHLLGMTPEKFANHAVRNMPEQYRAAAQGICLRSLREQRWLYSVPPGKATPTRSD